MPNSIPQPVIVGTDISNFIALKQNERPYQNGRGTRKGHIQVFVEVTPEGIVSKDPYGNAITGYKDLNMPFSCTSTILIRAFILF